jgi:hypothetical protein
MRWLLVKEGSELVCELRCGRGSGPYHLVLTKPDGTEEVEEVDEATSVVERTAELMNSLRSEGWRLS